MFVEWGHLSLTTGHFRGGSGRGGQFSGRKEWAGGDIGAVDEYAVRLRPVFALFTQVHSMIEKLAQYTDIRAVLVVGGLSLNVQAASLRSLPEIVVATPVSI